MTRFVNQDSPDYREGFEWGNGSLDRGLATMAAQLRDRWALLAQSYDEEDEEGGYQFSRGAQAALDEYLNDQAT